MSENLADRHEHGIPPYQAVTGEEYMNDDQKQHFRDILNSWKSSLMSELNRTIANMQQDEGHYADPSDRATREEEFALELRNRDRERKLLGKIDKTLRRIDDDEEYGFCEECGIEIGLKRLEVRPTAELCIDCKTTQEIKEKQQG